jgi:hypothetical protein
MDSRLRGNDGNKDVLQDFQTQRARNRKRSR